MNEYGDQNWKISIKVRNPTEKELRHPQFTLVKISHMNFPYTHLDENEQVDNLMKELSHIYHYYTRDGEESIYKAAPSSLFYSLINLDVLSTEGTQENKVICTLDMTMKANKQIEWRC